MLVHARRYKDARTRWPGGQRGIQAYIKQPITWIKRLRRPPVTCARDGVLDRGEEGARYAPWFALDSSCWFLARDSAAISA
jgi:hypothetical protein